MSDARFFDADALPKAERELAKVLEGSKLAFEKLFMEKLIAFAQLVEIFRPLEIMFNTSKDFRKPGAMHECLLTCKMLLIKLQLGDQKDSKADLHKIIDQMPRPGEEITVFPDYRFLNDEEILDGAIYEQTDVDLSVQKFDGQLEEFAERFSQFLTQKEHLGLVSKYLSKQLKYWDTRQSDHHGKEVDFVSKYRKMLDPLLSIINHYDPHQAFFCSKNYLSKVYDSLQTSPKDPEAAFGCFIKEGKRHPSEKISKLDIAGNWIVGMDEFLAAKDLFTEKMVEDLIVRFFIGKDLLDNHKKQLVPYNEEVIRELLDCIWGLKLKVHLEPTPRDLPKRVTARFFKDTLLTGSPARLAEVDDACAASDDPPPRKPGFSPGDEKSTHCS